MENKVRVGESSKNVTWEYLEVLNLIVERSLVLPLVHFLEGGDFFVEPFEQMVAGFSTLPDDFRVVGLAEQGRQAPEFSSKCSKYCGACGPSGSILDSPCHVFAGLVLVKGQVQEVRADAELGEVHLHSVRFPFRQVCVFLHDTGEVEGRLGADLQRGDRALLQVFLQIHYVFT